MKSPILRLTSILITLFFAVPVRADDDPKAPAHVDQFGDALPGDAIARIGTTRLKHNLIVKAMAFAPDGKSLASAGLDGVTCLWDPATGKKRLAIDNTLDPGYRNNWVASLAFTPDGTGLVGAPVDTPPRLWDAATGKEIRRFGEKTYRSNWVAISPDGKTLACGSTRDAGADRLYDLATAKLIHAFAERESRITPIAFSPDGKTLAACDDAGLVFFEFVAGQIRELPRPKTTTGRLGSLAFASDGQWVAGLREGKDIAIAEVPSGKILRTLTLSKYRDAIASIILAPDDKTFFASKSIGSVAMVDALNGKQIREIKDYAHGGPQMALSRDGKIVATVTDHREAHCTIHLWDALTGKSLLPTPGPHREITYVAVSPDSRHVATASFEAPGSVYLWDAATGKQLWKNDSYGPLAFMPDGKTLLCAGQGERRDVIEFLDVNTGKPTRQFDCGDRRIRHLALSNDGKLLAIIGDTRFRLLDPVSGRVIHDFGEQQRAHYHLAFAPDGQTLAALEGTFLKLWDTRTGKLIRQEQTQAIASLAFSPDGKTLALAGGGAYSRSPPPTIRLIDLATGKEFRKFQSFGSGLNEIAFTPDGRSIVLHAEFYTPLYLIEVATGQLRHKFAGHKGQITCAALAPNGRFAVSGSSDASALVWDLVGARSRQQPRPILTAADLDRLWSDLSKDDGIVAYQAICKLRASPKQAVALFERHIQPVATADAQTAADALRRLDSATFAVREQAAQELDRLRDAAEPILRKALTGNPSLELRRRIEQLLERKDAVELLRQGRAFEVLEHAADADSRRFLRKLADGVPNARLTTEAQGALARLDKIQPK